MQMSVKIVVWDIMILMDKSSSSIQDSVRTL